MAFCDILRNKNILLHTGAPWGLEGMVGGAPQKNYLARNKPYGTQTKLGWCKLDYLTIFKICSGLLFTFL